MAIVFVSSTYKDLKSYRKEVIDFLVKSKYLNKVDAKYMEDFAASPSSAKEESLRLVSECEIFIGIYAYRYGFKPRRDRKSLIEQEYDLAVEQNKKILCFVVDPAYDWPDDLDHREEFSSNTQLIERFKRKIKKKHVVFKFTNEGSLVNGIINALEIEKFSQLRNIYDEVSPEKKLNFIKQLIDKFETDEHNEQALIDVVGRIASRFKFERNATFPDMPEKIGILLQEGISPEQYLDTATREYPSAPREKLKQIAHLAQSYANQSDKLPAKAVTSAVHYIATDYKKRNGFPRGKRRKLCWTHSRRTKRRRSSGKRKTYSRKNAGNASRRRPGLSGCTRFCSLWPEAASWR